MKEWTVETLIAQLNYKVEAATGASVFDPRIGDLTVTDLIDVLKDHAFRQRMSQIEGQMAIPLGAEVTD